MVIALGTPKRHPESGIYWFRKRVPDRLKESVGKSEIKFSLRTRDPVVARIRNLEEMARIERAWSGIGPAIVDGRSPRIASLEYEDSSSRQVAAKVEPASGHASPPLVPAVEAAARTAIPLRSVFESYSREAELAPATVKRWSPVVDRLIGHLGHDDAATISRGNVVAWKDALLDGGMSNATVRDVYLAAARAMLQYAVDQGHLAKNPAAGVKVRVRQAPQERDKGFDGKEAETILSATLRKPSDKISVEMAAARRWVPWICAYTGARVNEITPLTRRDFVRRDGIWMIRIARRTTRRASSARCRSTAISSSKYCSTT